MLNESITDAIKSVLGEYASPEKIRALDAALRPIYGREAIAVTTQCGNFGDYRPEELTKDYGLPKFEMMHAIISDIRSSFGVTDND